ncbi:TIR domain-containing protein [Selenomonadales bacterium OttesenSCG-928-I06]|nr:TIR domain-containing protein [Selenomonadales bacterium OttesenSCG-928-I06]
MFSTPKHKAFISYDHNNDQKYKDTLLSLNSTQDLFEDKSLKEAGVLILLCGKNTKYIEQIDQEIQTAMSGTDNIPQLGIVVINLPESKNDIHGHSHEEKELIYPHLLDHKSLLYMDPYIKNYPDMPDRIIDNLKENIPISVVSWEQIIENPLILKQLIDIASDRKQNITYYNSREIIKS